MKLEILAECRYCNTDDVTNRHSACWDFCRESGERQIHSQKERESQEEGGTVVGEINQELMELWFKTYRRTFNFSVA